MTLNYDNTASAEANFVENELVSVLASAAVWPQEGAFYAKDFTMEGFSSVSKKRKELIEGRDFLFSARFKEKELEVGLGIKIYSYALILNGSEWTELTIAYRGVGVEDLELISLVGESGPDDTTDVASWLSFGSPVSREEGARPLPSGGGFLEVLAGRLTTIARMVRGNGQVELDEAVLRNKLSNNTQDLLLGGLVSSNSRQNLDIAELLKSNTLSDEILDALAVRNAAQDVLIVLNSEAGGTRDTRLAAVRLLNLNQATSISRAISDNGVLSTRIDEIEESITTKVAGLALLAEALNTTINLSKVEVTEASLKVSSLEQGDGVQTTTLTTLSQEVDNVGPLADQGTVIGGALGSRLTTVLGLGDNLALAVDNLTARNTAQDLLISTNEEAVNAISQLIIGVDLGLINAAIAVNANKNLSQDESLVGLSAKETEQNDLLDSLLARMIPLDGTVSPFNLTAILAAIDTADSKILDLGLEIEENQDRDDEQDARLQGIRDVINALGSASGVDLTSYQSQVDSNVGDIATHAANLAPTTTVNVQQDTDLTDQRSRIDTLKGGSFNYDTGPLVARTTAQDVALELGRDDEDVVRDKNLAQNVRLAELDGPLVVVGTADIPADLTGYQARVDAVANVMPVASSQIEAVSPNQPAQTSLSADQTAEIAVIAGGTDGVVILTAQIEIDISANETTLATVEAVEVVQTATVVTQDARLEAIKDHNVEQDDLIQDLIDMVYCGPTIITPDRGSIIDTGDLTVVASAFVPVAVGDIHVNTEWQVSRNDTFNTLIFSRISVILETSVVVPSIFDEGEYYIRVRYISTISGKPNWGHSSNFKIPYTLTNITDDILNYTTESPEFGSCVSADERGEYLLIGDPYYVGSGYERYCAGILFKFNPVTRKYDEDTVIKPSTEDHSNLGIGQSCSISPNGKWIALGGFSYDNAVFFAGCVGLWEKNVSGTWVERGIQIGPYRNSFGVSVSVNNEGHIISGNNGLNNSIIQSLWLHTPENMNSPHAYVKSHDIYAKRLATTQVDFSKVLAGHLSNSLQEFNMVDGTLLSKGAVTGVARTLHPISISMTSDGATLVFLDSTGVYVLSWSAVNDEFTISDYREYDETFTVISSSSYSGSDICVTASGERGFLSFATTTDNQERHVVCLGNLPTHLDPI